MAKAVGWCYERKDHIIATKGRPLHWTAHNLDINQRIRQISSPFH